MTYACNLGKQSKRAPRATTPDSYDKALRVKLVKQAKWAPIWARVRILYSVQNDKIIARPAGSYISGPQQKLLLFRQLECTCSIVVVLVIVVLLQILQGIWCMMAVAAVVHQARSLLKSEGGSFIEKRILNPAGDLGGIVSPPAGPGGQCPRKNQQFSSA